MAWKVTPSFSLPVGFELWEDTDVLELRCGKDLVGVFTHHATPSGILGRCKEYVEEKAERIKASIG